VNEFAFPMPGFTKTERHLDGNVTLNIPHSNGLTKRELFAAMALRSMANWDIKPEPLAKKAVAIADALLAELNKTPTGEG